MDIDMLARADPDYIRLKTIKVLEVCQVGGGYFLGAGNWVSNYIPIENYLAMIRAGKEFAF